MSCISHHSKTLRERGYRMTPQRVAVLKAMHTGGHLSPAQIYERVRDTGLTESTVYRTLDFLTRNGVIFSSVHPRGHLTYELAGSDHHHVVCRACGAQVQVKKETLQDTIEKLQQQTGYCLDADHVTLSGLCPLCQNKPHQEVKK